MNNGIRACMLRTYRRSWGLSQGELADLLGFQSPAQISRIEHDKRIPGLETALACSTLFGVSLPELFPRLATEIESRLVERASHLHEGLLHTTSLLALRKRELLSRALAGVSEGDKPPAYDPS